MPDPAEKTIDIVRGQGVSDVSLEPRDGDVGHHSPAWAEVVRPFTVGFLIILSAAMFLPFLFLWNVRLELPADAINAEAAASAASAVAQERTRAALDWAKTILPSAVGFGSAIVGYYFGTRSQQRSDPAKQGSSSPDAD